MKPAVSLEVSVQDVHARMGGSVKPLLIDVREEWEWDIGHIEGARLVPMSMLSGVAHELPKDAPIVLYCHSGIRSRAAAAWLRGEGFALAQSMAGGTKAWSRDIDPELAEY